MPQSYSSLHVHVVFSTKDRRPWIHGGLVESLYPYLGGIARELGCPAIAIGGMPDHVHLLVDLAREQAISAVIRNLKAGSSKWIHDEVGDHTFAWQAGYGAFAVSRSHLDEVKRYIDRQAEHHRVRTFQEEFRALLERHGIAFDERYLWA